MSSPADVALSVLMMSRPATRRAIRGLDDETLVELLEDCLDAVQQRDNGLESVCRARRPASTDCGGAWLANGYCRWHFTEVQRAREDGAREYLRSLAPRELAGMARVEIDRAARESLMRTWGQR